MKVTIEEINNRQEPIDCIGIKARREGPDNWIVGIEEYDTWEFNVTDIELLDLVNLAQGKRYRKCIAWSQIAGCNYACFEMCDEWQRNECSRQQKEDIETNWKDNRWDDLGIINE